MATAKTDTIALFDRTIILQAPIADSFGKAQPAPTDAQPGDLRH